MDGVFITHGAGITKANSPGRATPFHLQTYVVGVVGVPFENILLRICGFESYID